MDKDQNKAIIQRYSEAVWINHELEIIDEVFARDAIIHSPLSIHQGRETMREIVDKWLTAFPDLEVECHDHIAEDNKVVSRWTATATHMGSFFETSPTHKEISYAGVTTYALADGKVVEYWALVDMHAILRQLQEYEHIAEVVE